MTGRFVQHRWWWAAGLAAILAASAGGWHAFAAWKSAYPKDFAVVMPGELCRSAQPTAAQLQTVLDVYKIATVISLRTEKERALDPRVGEEAAFLAQRGVTFLELPTNTPPSPEQIQAFLDAMNDPAQPRPILLHCAAGRVRTGACVAIWRILHQGWPVEQALEEARRFGLKDQAVITVVRHFQAAQAGAR